MSYLHEHARRAARTPAGERPPDRPEMTRNTDGGGFVFELDSLGQLRRWLILGSETGSYYANAKDVTFDNIGALHRALAEHGVDAVDVIRDVSVSGAAKKQDPTLYALAVACAYGEVRNAPAKGTPGREAWEAECEPAIAVRQRALEALPEIARTGSHLFMWASFVDEMRGWGPALVKAVRRWYAAHPDGGLDGAANVLNDPGGRQAERDGALERLAYQAVKYRQRHGWTHRDLLKLAHPTPPTSGHDALYRWIAGDAPKNQATRAEWTHHRRFRSDLHDPDGARGLAAGLPRIIEGFEAAQRSPSPERTAHLVRDFRLPHEAIRTEHKTDPGVNMALLEAGMPMTALIRNLANMTRYGVLEQGGEGEKIVLAQFANAEAIARARVHPMAVLIAMHVYASGRSVQPNGKVTTWVANHRIVDALDEAFYLAFGNVEPTGKRRLIALDVSASMTWPENRIKGAGNLTAREASAAMAMVSVRSGDPTDVVTFSEGLEPLALSARQRLDDVTRAVSRLRATITDISLPTEWARSHARSYDAFEVYTDNEVNAGVHPFQSMRVYRQGLVRDARYIVVGMSATRFTVADPRDPLMLDVVGFDATAPALMADFIAGRV